MPKPRNSTQLSSLKTRWRRLGKDWRDQLADIDALPQLTFLGLFTGILAGLVIVVFKLLADVPLRLYLPINSENFEALSAPLRFFLPLMGAILLGGVLQLLNKQHHATGVSHVLDRIHNHQARLPWGNFFTQLFGGAWCLATGQSLGREGPIVHLGAASGSLLGQYLHLPNNSLRPLAGCGVAAAIAACFNTPMAGVIFAMEVVVMEYSIAGFIPVILAAVAGAVINQLAFGSDTVFHPPAMALGSLWELPLIAATGLLIAVVGSGYIRLQAYACKLSLNRPILLRFAVAGLIAGAGSALAPQIMGVGYDTIDSALVGQFAVSALLGILVAKWLVTGIGLGVGLPGGVIAPLLLMGACVGGIAGILVNQLMPHAASPIGFYVMLGMGAMMGAVLNAPLAAMMATLELTYNPNIIFPSMLMVVIACLATRWVFRCDGLFPTLLEVQGKKNSFAAAEQLLSRTGARKLLDNHIHITTADVTFAQARELLNHHPHWIVLRESKRLLNPVDLANFLNDNPADANAPEDLNARINLEEIPARRLDTIELDERTTLYHALHSMNHAQVDAAYIVCKDKPRLGIITRNKIEQFYRF